MRLKVSFLLVGVLLGVNVFAQLGGGDGSFSDPYKIGNPRHLKVLSENESYWSGNYYYELTSDIDMTGEELTPIGSTDHVFKGFFDGGKHFISNLTISPVPVDGFVRKGTGLFGAFSGTLKNLGLINTNIDVSAYANSSRVGAFAGELVSGSISECFSEGGVINVGGGGWTGGIVGGLFYGGSKSIENCYSTTNIMAGWGSGGIVGANRGSHKIDKVAFYGTTNGQPAITTVQIGTVGQKEGIPPTNAVYKAVSGLSDANAAALVEATLMMEDSYPAFDFEGVWIIDDDKGYAVINDKVTVPELDFFEKIKTQRVESDQNIEWKNFGPGMSGYNEEFWCHPTDPDVMFMGPDMHVAYGTWDNGKSWHSIKDYDGDGLGLERVNDIQFSLIHPDYGVAIERRGKVFVTNDRGRTWELIYLIPHAATSPWYNAHSRIAIHPTDDKIWYIGAGGFWDVKATHRSKANPHGNLSDTYAYGYILKTTDGGITWKKIATDISDDLDVGRIMINPINPDRIVIATGHGMFLSTDAGETWAESGTGLPNNLPKDLAAYYNPDTKEYILYTVEQSVYSESGNTITTKGGVFKSTDGGATWTNITGNLGLNFKEITDYTFRDRYAGAVAYWLGKSKSEIAAKEYPSHTLQVFRRLVVNPWNKNELYLVPNQRHDKSFGPGDIWKTEDGGLTWKICARHGSYWRNNTDQAYWASKGMVTTPNVEFSHMQASLDELSEAYSANRSLAINAKGDVFIGINQQTHRSNDGGATWQQIDDYETTPGSNAWVGRGDSNLPGRFILTETGIPDRMLLCSGEHGLWQTTDLGDYPDKDAVAVTQIEGQVHDVNGNHSAHSVSTVAVHPNDPNTIFILAWRQEHRGWLRKTTDGGKTWNNVVQLFDADNQNHEALASQYSLQIDPKNPDNMYFTAIYKPISCGTNSGPGVELTKGEYGVHRSTDGGLTWTVNNSGLPGNASVNRIVMHPDDPEVLFAALNQWTNSDPYGLYKSTDKAEHWIKMNIPSQIRSVNDVFIDRNTKFLYISCGARSGAYDAGGVWRSKDEGVSWELLFKAPYVWYAKTSPINPNKMVVFAAGQTRGAFKNPGFYLSMDDGETWTKINKGIGQPDKMVDLQLDPYNENILWSAGWGSGWFKAMIPSEGVKAVCNNAEVEENETLTLYAMGSLGSQLEYEWEPPEGIGLSSYNKYKTTFTAPEVMSDSILVFKLKVSNQESADMTEVRVTVKNKMEVSARTYLNDVIKLYPNPVGDFLRVEALSASSKYRIMNLEGRVIQTGVMTDASIDTSGLSRGAYLLDIRSEEEILVHKFIKQ